MYFFLIDQVKLFVIYNVDIKEGVISKLDACYRHAWIRMQIVNKSITVRACGPEITCPESKYMYTYSRVSLYQKDHYDKPMVVMPGFDSKLHVPTIQDDYAWTRVRDSYLDIISC